jgi:PKD repeat protein
MAIDFPDGMGRILPGNIIDIQTGFGRPWNSTASLVVLTTAMGSCSITISDDDFVYFIDMISVSPSANKEFKVEVFINDIHYITAAGLGWLDINLRQNQSLALINTDVVRVEVTNLDGSTRTFDVDILGTKLIRPADYGNVPIAAFSFAPPSPMINEDITFSELSRYDPTSWEWDFADGSALSTERNPVHQFTAVGVYAVRLKAVNAVGFDTQYHDVSVGNVVAVDFTGFTEVDQQSLITISASKVANANLSDLFNSYVYKDYGAAHFHDIVLRADVLVSNFSNNLSNAWPLGFANAVGNLYSAAGIKLGVRFSNLGGTHTMVLALNNGTSVLASNGMNVSYDTHYYLTLERVGGTTTCTCKVYSDAARLVLVATLTITHASVNTDFRYLYACSSYYDTNDYRTTFETNNMQISP